VKAFFAQFSVKNLLKDVESFVGKRTVHFLFNKVSYTATLDDYQSGYPDVHHQLTVRLSSDGYRFSILKHSEIKRSGIFTHRCPEWSLLHNESVEEKLPRVFELSRELGCEVVMLYNSRFKRIDIAFVDGDNSVVKMKVTFEIGIPDYWDQGTYLRDIQGK